MMCYRFTTLFILPTILLTGCMVGPNYERPSSQVPNNWKWDCSRGECETEPVENWWEIFDDKTLDCLEKQAAAANQNLKKAIATVLQERAMIQLANSRRYPHLNFDPSISQSNLLYDLYGIPPVFGPPLQRFHTEQNFLPLDLSYEVDLWGRIQRNYQAAIDNAEASEEAFNVVFLTLSADVAANYFAIRTIDAQQQILDETVANYENQLDLTNRRLNAGLVGELDVSEAEQALYEAKAQSLENQRLRASQENALAVLVGMPASEFKVDFNPLLETPPCVPVGLPSELLLRRPDIAEAERTMAAVHEQIGIAYAGYFPSLNLSTSYGFQSPRMFALGEGRSRYSAFSANASQMLFDAGATTAQVHIAKAQFDAALADYQETVLTGFQEVEDALADLNWLSQSYEALQASVKFSSTTNDLTSQRYVGGLANYLEVIITERAVLQARNNLIATLGNRYRSTINLIKAIGGSWEPIEITYAGLDECD